MNPLYTFRKCEPAPLENVIDEVLEFHSTDQATALIFRWASGTAWPQRLIIYSSGRITTRPFYLYPIQP